MEVLRIVRTFRRRVMPVGAIRTPRARATSCRQIARSLAVAAVLATAPTGIASAQGQPARWPIKVREHVDLWLHAFALVSRDSSDVPIFRSGYRDAMLQRRATANIVTGLDANAAALRTTLESRPGLLSAQFLAQEFASWADLEVVLDAVARTEENRRALPQALAPAIARVGAIFRTREERDFLRRFLAGLRAEREQFHHEWWVAETRRRDPALTLADSLWVTRYRPALQRFLNHTQQGDGEIILSTVLEGEGRTTSDDKRRNTIVVGFPTEAAQGEDAIFALMHELVGPLTAVAVEDNVTPAEKRSGVADRLQSSALVRGGAILAARVGADAAGGYMRFYLRATGRQAGSDLSASFAAAFPLREGMLESIERQIAVAFSGI
jgi:hypothetical protein